VVGAPHRGKATKADGTCLGGGVLHVGALLHWTNLVFWQAASVTSCINVSFEHALNLKGRQHLQLVWCCMKSWVSTGSTLCHECLAVPHSNVLLDECLATDCTKATDLFGV